MTIYPKDINRKTLTRTWQLAALNLTVPDDLTDPDDRWEWARYAEYLPPEKMLHTLGEALDKVFGGVIGKDMKTATTADKIRLISNWEAAGALLHTVFENFPIRQPLSPAIEEREDFTTDRERTLYSIATFMKSVNSPEAPLWEQRRNQYREIADNQELWTPLDSFRKEYFKPDAPRI
ncbi:MAG: hypothetical protein ACAH83_11820 [Alphaproteobacteria bacterium]